VWRSIAELRFCHHTSSEPKTSAGVRREEIFERRDGDPDVRLWEEYVAACETTDEP